MATRKRKNKGIGTNTLLGVSVGVFVLVIAVIFTQTNILQSEVFESIEDVFTLQSIGDVQTTKCFIKFEMRAFATDGSLIKVVGSSADITSTGAIDIGRIFEGELLSFADREGSGKTVSRYEIQPELRCDKPNQSSGPIGWGVLQTKLSVLIFAHDPSFTGQTIGTISSPSFKLTDIHDNFAHKFPIIKINQNIIDDRLEKRTFDYDSRITFVLGGGIHLTDKSRPSLTFTHFVSLSPSPLVTSQHQVKVKALVKPPIDLPKETIVIESMKRISDNGNLLDFSTAINTKGTQNERTIKVLAWLDEFRGTTINANEPFPKASLFCLPQSDPGGVCQTLSTIGKLVTMVKNDASATGSLADFFKTELIVPFATPAGTYGLSVFSDDRDGVSSRAFLIVSLLTEADCKADEELINNRCVEVIDEKVSCTFPLVRDAVTNTCVKNENEEKEECEAPLVDDGAGGCKSVGTNGEVNGDVGMCEEDQSLVGGKCVPKTTQGDGTADAYFQYTTNLAGAQLSGTINQEGVFSFESLAIIGLDVEQKPRNLVEIRVTPILDTNDLGAGVQIKSGTTINTARADLLVNGVLELQNFNIDYPQRTFGQVSSGGLATFGLIGIQPAEIIDDASKRLDDQGRSDPLVFLNNDKLTVSVTFSNVFEFTQGGKTFKGVISPMNAQFPFTFIQGSVTGGENEGCKENEIFSQSLQACLPVANPCETNQTLIGGHCVDNRNPNPDGSCNSNEVKVAGVCLPASPSPTGACTLPLVKNPDTSVGGCIIPSTNDNPKCDLGTVSLFDPACLFITSSGSPSGDNGGDGGTCAQGETPEACQTRLSAATPIISGGTLTFAIVGFVVLIIGVVIVAVIQSSRRKE